MNVEMVDAAQKDWVDVRMEKFAALVRHVGWGILAPNLAAWGNLKFLRSVTRIPPLVRNSIVENIEHVARNCEQHKTSNSIIHLST